MGVDTNRFIDTGYSPYGVFIPNPGAETDDGRTYRIRLDVDGSPYLSKPIKSTDYGVDLDTDGNPYYRKSSFALNVYLDTDNNPYF